MRIAILTFHSAFNCGAMLQAWALQAYLQRLGHIVEFPDVNRVGWTDGRSSFQTHRHSLLKIAAFLRWLWCRMMSFGMSRPWRSGFESFMRKHLNLASVAVGEISSTYECIIVGSDQVWNPRIAREFLPLFLCQGVSGNIRKIAYAVSVGDDPHCVNEQSELFVECLPQFNAGSVRENAANEALKRFTQHPFVEVVDPTLLLDSEDYACLEDVSRVPNEPYLFAYFVLGPTRKFAAYVHDLGRRLRVKVVVACNYRDSRVGDPWGMTYGVTPGQMLGLIKHAKYVVAASFHGTVFALHYQRPFLVLREKVDVVESRPASLARKVDCANRVVNLEDSILDAERRLLAPLPGDLKQRIKSLRATSEDWLQLQLKGA